MLRYSKNSIGVIATCQPVHPLSGARIRRLLEPNLARVGIHVDIQKKAAQRRREFGEKGVKSKGRVAQIGSFEKKIVQKVAMVC